VSGRNAVRNGFSASKTITGVNLLMRRLHCFFLFLGLTAVFLPVAPAAAGDANQAAILQTGSVLGNIEPCRS